MPFLSAYMLLIRTNHEPDIDNMLELLKFANVEYIDIDNLKDFLKRAEESELREEIFNSTTVYFEDESEEYEEEYEEESKNER